MFSIPLNFITFMAFYEDLLETILELKIYYTETLKFGLSRSRISQAVLKLEEAERKFTSNCETAWRTQEGV